MVLTQLLVQVTAATAAIQGWRVNLAATVILGYLEYRQTVL
jgi:hypothetical protein